jgi:diguanylate cyclase (GGDEF)-like protein
VKEISARKQLERELLFLSTRDLLTKLLNRSQLEPALLHAIATVQEGRPAAVLYIDLDNPKIGNDTLGHEAGDRLLTTLSTLLKNATRPGDELVRFGGDEFVVILLDAEVEKALAVAERLREKNSSLAQLIADTDWATRIGEAMKDGSLELWFQPVVDTRTRELLYHETLLRYIDPGHTMIISPGAVLNSAQRSGQGIKLDRFVIERAISMLENDPNISAGVNLAAPSFNDHKLIEVIGSSLQSHNVDASRFFLEITESEIISHLDRAREVLQSIKDMGVQIALDDFGADFSSLAYLKKLPVDFLKIDGSFMRDLVNNSFNQAIIRGIREVAEIKNIRTIAEYVENQDQMDLLAELGVDYVQGFFIGKPRSRAYTTAEVSA